MDARELEALIAKVKLEGEMAEAMAEAMAEVMAKAMAKAMAVARAEADALEEGKFFSPWTDVWTEKTVLKKECKGAFEKVCRGKDFAGSVPRYKDVLERSRSESEWRRDASKELVEPDTPKAAKKPRAKIRNKLDLIIRSSSSSTSSIQRKRNTAASQRSRNSGRSSLSGNSKASSLSQSLQYPDFGGGLPSTRAHMIPDPYKTSCYKYYSVICQAVLGFRCNEVARLERMAWEMAVSHYNLLRAPTRHGEYFDSKPCWILVPACPFEEIRNWKPDHSYPVLAVARGFSGTTVEDAYRMMCRFGYNDKSFDPVGKRDGLLKRSKCKKKEFVEATENLRQMTLAMAETLVGQDFQIRPDQILGNRYLRDGDFEYIKRKLKSNTAEEEDGKISGEEESEKSRTDLQVEDYHKVQFDETRASLKNGIKLPEAKPELDLNHCELFQFEVDPARKLDLFPDPMLLLIKAAINWSWSCNQKLLPACGRANEEEEEEELVGPSTPIPTEIEFQSVPVTPDDDVLLLV